MVDWEKFVAERMSLPDLAPERERRIVREVAQQLEDFQRDAVLRGLSVEDAEALTLRQIEDWSDFAGSVSEAHRLRARLQPRLDRMADRAESLARQRRGWWPIAAELPRSAAAQLRSVAKAPGFFALATLTLALGIGAVSTLFSLLHAIVISPLPFDEQNRLVTILMRHRPVGWRTLGSAPRGTSRTKTATAFLDDLAPLEVEDVDRGEGLVASAALHRNSDSSRDPGRRQPNAGPEQLAGSGTPGPTRRTARHAPRSSGTDRRRRRPG